MDIKQAKFGQVQNVVRLDSSYGGQSEVFDGIDLTTIKGGVSGFAWSPDSRRLALVVEEETDSVARKDTAERKTPKPIAALPIPARSK